MKIGFIADEITSFIKDHDSTWSIMKASYTRGHEVFYAHHSSVSFANQIGRAQFIKLDTEFFDYQVNHQAKLIKFPVLPLDENARPEKYPCKPFELDSMDVIFMRSDPPVSEEYIFTCQILSLCKKAKVINSPISLLLFNEKLSILNFPELISPTMVSSSISEIKSFIQSHGKSVIKPLNAMAGIGVFVLELEDKNLNSIIETSLQRSKSLMVQKYIPEINQGDKRIIIINGNPEGALLRIPSPDDNRANLAAGGNFARYSLNERDLYICSQLKNFLIENGIYLAGIDVIGGYLTEINITSPTCLQEIDRMDDREEKLSELLIRSLET
jgi:glutathione synthase